MNKTVAELTVELRELGLPVSGRKAELVHRLKIHLNPPTHGVPRSPGQLQNPKTRALSQLMQQRRDEWRELCGVPLGIPIGGKYDTGEVDEDTKQPIMARIYAKDALPPHNFRTREEKRALLAQDAVDTDGEEE